MEKNDKKNIDRIQIIVSGLKELNQEVVYVGGAVVGLYSDQESSPEPRATEDVDCIVKYHSHKERMQFEEQLRKHHFTEDLEDGVICRWKHNGTKVDIMPTQDSYLSFTNKWYEYGFDSRTSYQLPSGEIIFIMPPTAFVASKFEALHSRGGNDFRCSQDFEDIIYILNTCNEFLQHLTQEVNIELKEYLKNQAKWLLERSTITEEIECVLPYGEEERSKDILTMIRLIADLM